MPPRRARGPRGARAPGSLRSRCPRPPGPVRRCGRAPPTRSPGWRLPLPAADVRQPLSLGQVRLAAAQRPLRATRSLMSSETPPMPIVLPARSRTGELHRPVASAASSRCVGRELLELHWGAGGQDLAVAGLDGVGGLGGERFVDAATPALRLAPSRSRAAPLAAAHDALRGIAHVGAVERALDTCARAGRSAPLGRSSPPSSTPCTVAAPAPDGPRVARTPSRRADLASRPPVRYSSSAAPRAARRRRSPPRSGHGRRGNVSLTNSARRRTRRRRSRSERSADRETGRFRRPLACVSAAGSQRDHEPTHAVAVFGVIRAWVGLASGRLPRRRRASTAMTARRATAAHDRRSAQPTGWPRRGRASART